MASEMSKTVRRTGNGARSTEQQVANAPRCSAILRAAPRFSVLHRAAPCGAPYRAAHRAGPGNTLPRARPVGDGASMGSNEFATTIHGYFKLICLRNHHKNYSRYRCNREWLPLR